MNKLKDIKDFDKPLNTPIITEEEVERINPRINPETKEVTFQKTKEKVPVSTTYHYVKPEKVSCQKGKHKWYMKDKKKYVVSCPNCMRNRTISPLTQTIIDGHIALRKTGEYID